MELATRLGVTLAGMFLYKFGQGYVILSEIGDLGVAFLPTNPLFANAGPNLTFFSFGLIPYFIATAVINVSFLIKQSLRSLPETEREKLIDFWTYLTSLFLYVSLLLRFRVTILSKLSVSENYKVSLALFFGIIFFLTIIKVLNIAGLGNKNALSFLVITNLFTNLETENINYLINYSSLISILTVFLILWGELKAYTLFLVKFNTAELKTALNSNSQKYYFKLNQLNLLPLLGVTIFKMVFLPDSEIIKIIILNSIIELVILSIILFFVNRLILQTPKLALALSTNNSYFSNLYPGRQTNKYLTQTAVKLLGYNVSYIFFVFKLYSLVCWGFGLTEALPIIGLFIIVKTIITVFVQSQQYLLSSNLIKRRILTF